MRVVLQRVKNASVEIENQVTGKIGVGLLVFLGVCGTDTQKECDFLVDKLINLRIFTDDEDKMNLSLQDVGGELLIVSQFTLYGNCKKGRRPSFTEAAGPETATALYEYFIQKAKDSGVKKVETGVFGADMQVFLQNDGPVTLLLDTDEIMKRGAV